MSIVSKAEKANDHVTSKFVYSVFEDHCKVLGRMSWKRGFIKRPCLL
jgi:hypothetical protein